MDFQVEDVMASARSILRNCRRDDVRVVAGRSATARDRAEASPLHFLLGRVAWREEGRLGIHDVIANSRCVVACSPAIYAQAAAFDVRTVCRFVVKDDVIIGIAIER